MKRTENVEFSVFDQDDLVSRAELHHVKTNLGEKLTDGEVDVAHLATTRFCSQQFSSFASVGFAEMDKSGQRTCLPRGSVRQHTSTVCTCVTYLLCLLVSLGSRCVFIHIFVPACLARVRLTMWWLDSLCMAQETNRSIFITHLSEPNLLVASGSVFLEVP